MELDGLELGLGVRDRTRYVHHDMPTVQRLEREAFSEQELRDLTSWLEAAYADPAGSWRDEMWPSSAQPALPHRGGWRSRGLTHASSSARC